MDIFLEKDSDNQIKLPKKIRQSNELIESPYAQEFSAHEIKIFEIAVANCTQEDESFILKKTDKEFFLTNGELAKLLNTKPNVISMEIEKTAQRITKKTMHLRRILPDKSVEFETVAIIPYARYKDGVFKFRLNYSIIPYLVEINKNFTEFQLHNLLSMSSSYSIKLYKLLYQYKNIGKRIFMVNSLKEQFGILDKYSKYSDFKKRVLDSSIFQINKLTDLEVDYKEIKYGRKVEKIEFTFKIKKLLLEKDSSLNNKSLNNKEDFAKILEPISSFISLDTENLVIKCIKNKGIDYVEASIDYAKKNSKTNLDKYLADTLNNGWVEVELKKSQEKAAVIQKKLEAKEKEKQQKHEEEDKILENKRNLEEEYYTLTDIQKNIYNDVAKSITKVYSENLTKIFGGRDINFIEEKITLCVFAVSTRRSYDKIIELYCYNMLQVDLVVQNSLF